MKRVQNNEPWTLMCSTSAPASTSAGVTSSKSCIQGYEREGRGGGATIKSQDLWFRILTSQVETGLPYMLYNAYAIESQISNISGPSNRPICARRSWNTRALRRWLCAISPLSALSVRMRRPVRLSAPRKDCATSHTKFGSCHRRQLLPTSGSPLQQRKASASGSRVQGLADVF